MDEPPERGLLDVVWHKKTPLKASLFVWRLFRNRLPTKDNLLRRQMLHSDNITCVGGCGSLENGGLNCVFFFLVFSKLKHTDQKQLRTTSEVMFRNKMQRIKSERLPKTESSPVPLALPRRVH